LTRFFKSLNRPITQSPDKKMAIPHFIAMLLFSFLVSVVFAVLSKASPRDQFIYGAKVFVGFVGVAVILGWLMYFLPR